MLFRLVPCLPLWLIPAGVLAATHQIEVGSPVHKFSPDTIDASIGDIVQFRFHNSRHSVVRAAYRTPCSPYEVVEGGGQHGFFSGFKEVKAGDEIQTWDLKINSTEALFFYCSAPRSCNEYVMVGVINPNLNVSLDVQKDLARKTDTVLQPGQTVAPEGHPSDAKHIHLALPTPAIIGISVGGALFIGLAAALFFFMGRSRSLAEEAERHGATVTRKTWEPPHYEPPVNSAMSTINGNHVLPSYEMRDAKVPAVLYGNHSYMPGAGAGDAWQMQHLTARSPGPPGHFPGAMDAGDTAHELDVSSNRPIRR